MTAHRFAPAHLDLRMTALNRACRAVATAQQQENAQLDRPDLTDRVITDRQLAVLLARVDGFVTAPVCPPMDPAVRELDLAAEAQLRALAGDAGVALPLDVLSACFGLAELDRQALVAVAAPELDRGYERIYAYLCDEFERRHPSVELLVLLTQGLVDRHEQRLAFGPYGTLRSRRLLVEHGDSASDLRQQLRLGRGVLEFLLGAPVDVRSLGRNPVDPAVEGLGTGVVCRPEPMVRLAATVSAGSADVIGIWGRRDLTEAAATELAAALDRQLDRVALSAQDPDQQVALVRDAAVAAGPAGSLLWLPVDGEADPAPGVLDSVATLLGTIRTPIVVTAVMPWRPVGVLARRRWVEVWATYASLPERAHRWRLRHPDLTDVEATELAARFRLGPEAEAAASRLALAAGSFEPEPPVARALERACAAVSTPRPDRFLSVHEPGRGARDLVLPVALHRQVLELARFARGLPLLAESWPRLGQRGLKALFTGDPGTGKTLAAEVIASLLGVQLIKVDLSRVVSKWVGETAKNLDAVFALADGSSAVLFFDEADALFGKRGEVRHGTDRYANTEVSHLLQRFDEHEGLVILASNLRDQIDPAFTRRFHSVLHFPRPEEPERRRLWELLLSRHNGCTEVDFRALATLDLTGAGIVGAARTAALLAAAEGTPRPSMVHLASAVARQFRSEGRLAPPADLAALADLATTGNGRP